jgi:hypothetical protein
LKKVVIKKGKKSIKKGKKYQDSQTHNKSKSDEISQLKLTIDRMSRLFLLVD